MSYRSRVWRIYTYCTYFSQGSWNNVGVPLFQESLLSEYEDYGHFQFLFFFARTRLYQFIDQTNVWRFSCSRKGINFQLEICAYILKERNNETSKLVRGIQLTEVVCVIQNGMTKLALLNYLVMSWGVCHFFINGWYIDLCYRFRLFDLCCWPWEVRLYLLWW